MVDDRRHVSRIAGLVGDETPVEHRTDEEVDDNVEVGGGRDVATLAGVEQDLPDRLAAALGEPEVHSLQHRIALRGIDEGGHQSGKARLAQQPFGPREQFDQVATQVAGRGQRELVRREGVHGFDEQAFSGCPAPVERGFAGPGALGDGVDREAPQAVLGEHVKRRAQHPRAGVFPAQDWLVRRRWLSPGALAGRSGRCLPRHERNGSIPGIDTNADR